MQASECFHLGVLVTEPSHNYRLLGPVVEAAARRGWQVTCWHYAPENAATDLADIFPPEIAARLRKIAFAHFDELEALTGQVDGVITLWAPARFEVRPHTPWLVLQRTLDIFPDVNTFLSADATCIFSPYWIEFYLRYRQECGEAISAEAEAEIRRRCVVTGFAEMDVAFKLDLQEIRRRWGVPPDKKVVVYLTCDACSHWKLSKFCEYVYGLPNFIKQLWKFRLHRQWRYLPHIFKGWHDKNLVKRVRRFCDDNNAFMIAKGRQKYEILDYEEQAADLAVMDKSVYPPTILEVLAIADLAIGFYSSTAVEAAALRVPFLNIDLQDEERLQSNTAMQTLLMGKDTLLWNTPGCAHYMTLPQFFGQFHRKKLADFALEEAAWQRYTQKYLGVIDGKASERVLDAFARMVKERGS